MSRRSMSRRTRSGEDDDLEADDKEGDRTFEVHVRLGVDSTKPYQVHAACTIADLKAQIQPDVTASAWQLRRGARSLANDKTLAALGVGVGAKLRVWICPSKAVRAARYQALKVLKKHITDASGEVVKEVGKKVDDGFADMKDMLLGKATTTMCGADQLAAAQLQKTVGANGVRAARETIKTEKAAAKATAKAAAKAKAKAAAKTKSPEAPTAIGHYFFHFLATYTMIKKMSKCRST